MHKLTQEEAEKLLNKRLEQVKCYNYRFCCRDFFRKELKKIDDHFDSLIYFFYKWHRSYYSWLVGDLDDSDGIWRTRVSNGGMGAEIDDSGVVDVGTFHSFVFKSFRYEHTVISQGFRITDRYIYAGHFMDGELHKGYLYIPESGMELHGSFNVHNRDRRIRCSLFYEPPGIASYFYAKYASFEYFEYKDTDLYYLNDAFQDYVEAVLNGDNL